MAGHVRFPVHNRSNSGISTLVTGTPRVISEYASIPSLSTSNRSKSSCRDSGPFREVHLSLHKWPGGVRQLGCRTVACISPNHPPWSKRGPAPAVLSCRMRERGRERGNERERESVRVGDREQTGYDCTRRCPHRSAKSPPIASKRHHAT